MNSFKSILIVEDDPIALFVQKNLIERARITQQIISKTTGQEGLNFIKEEISKGNKCPDLIILDLNMPVMDGIEFLDYIQNIDCQSEVKIIVVTNSYLRDDKIKNHSGINYYIEKPLTREKLEDALVAIVS